ncbi:hypothetical protein [Sphingobium indicum]|uniref:hypothetical protein n=1 Tax=Sphingobium indicum TaxID=332055 RepID=UPI0012DD7859|nr:hypothetical protein [Sphingobium indicum]
MRIVFDDTKRPLAAAKLLARHADQVSLSEAQQAIARAAGYRDWHELKNSIGLKLSVSPHDDVNTVKYFILHVADALKCEQGDVQYALTKSRLFSLTLERNLSLRAIICRELFFGPSERGAVGALVRVPALRGGELGYLKPDVDGYSRILYNSGFGGCASTEVITPKVTPEDFTPSILWLPYGYWRVSDGSIVAFSRDYKPLWRINKGVAEPTNPWEWIPDICEEFWFREIARSTTWSYGPARDLAMNFLAENRIFEAPRLVDAMPFLFEQGEKNVDGAVKRLEKSKLNTGRASTTPIKKFERVSELKEGRSYPFIDFPVGDEISMQLRLEQRGWRIAHRLPVQVADLPPVRDGYSRWYGLDWIRGSNTEI